MRWYLANEAWWRPIVADRAAAVRRGLADPRASLQALSAYILTRSWRMQDGTKPMKAEMVFSQRSAIRQKRLSRLKKHST